MPDETRRTGMILNKEQIEAMFEAAKPLIKWMAENCHPHCTAIVDATGVEVLEGIAAQKTNEYIGD